MAAAKAGALCGCRASTTISCLITADYGLRPGSAVGACRCSSPEPFWGAPEPLVHEVVAHPFLHGTMGIVVRVSHQAASQHFPVWLAQRGLISRQAPQTAGRNQCQRGPVQ